MKGPTRWEISKKLLLRKRLEEIVAIPATLYFPTGIVAQLNEICDESGYTPGQLIVKALKGQIYHWDKFYQYVSTPPEKSGGFYLARGSPVLLSVCLNCPFFRLLNAKRLRSHCF
jgi:hypothetical protein